ncbi:MAG: DUF1080 domain-containing protein [Gemmatimonadota bacterium]
MSILLPLAAASFLVTAPGREASPAIQSQAPLIGRWDLVIDAKDRHKAGWLEVRHSGRSMLVGAFVGTTGSARPISRVDFKDGTFHFTIPPQWDDAEGDNAFTGQLHGDSISGTISYDNGTKLTFRGARAPTLHRTAAPVWGSPVKLLNGRDLTGWKTLGEGQSQWEVIGGVLHNKKGGTDLVTENSYNDFKLHVEFRYPKGSNSGIYLRGRYEVQVEDTPSKEPMIDGIGSIYGHLTPNEMAALGPDIWQTYDITLVGRQVTVILNGKTVISHQAIPGITGGAIDSNEGAPGPIFLQGDHGPVEYRNIVITAAK